MKILVVAAHPDDEVLGCGGTIARLAKEGNDVYIAILGEGITSRYEKQEAADNDLIKSLHSKAKKVKKLLGCKEIFFYNLPDNRFDAIPLLDVIKIVEELIKKLLPNTIYTHHAGDLNIDHVIVHRAVMTATRPQVFQSVKELYSFEVPSSTEWSFDQFNKFKPNVYFDISSTLETKIKAMSFYETEIRDYPHPRSEKALRSIAHRRGTEAGLIAAEVFQLIRKIY